LHKRCCNPFPTPEYGERLTNLTPPADTGDMPEEMTPRTVFRCTYIRACYLADELKCFGYKTDCPLYRKCNGEYSDEAAFHEAMDRLIDRTRAVYAGLDK